MDNCGNSRANTCAKGVSLVRLPAFIRPNSQPGLRVPRLMVTQNNSMLIARSRLSVTSFKCLPYQLSMVGYTLTMVVTGNGESGFDSGEGA